MKYQHQIVLKLIEEQEAKVEVLRSERIQGLEMQAAMRCGNEVWTELTKMLKPYNHWQANEKKLELHEKLLEFLKLKQSALELMIAKSRDPKVKDSNNVNVNNFVLLEVGNSTL